MSLVTILAFAVLFWRAEEQTPWLLVSEGDVLLTALIVLVQPPLVALASVMASRRTRRLFVSQPNTPQVAQHFFHRAGLIIRSGIVAGFAVTVLLTRWPDWFAFGGVWPALQIVGDLVVLTPFVVGCLVLWILTYPAERMLRTQSLGRVDAAPAPAGSGWPFRSYLAFQVRHQLLIVAVPMTAILFAADLTRGYEDALQSLIGSVWAPDVVLGAAVVSVFMVSPLMLRRIWRTSPLADGAVRTRLEDVGRRIKLRFCDILLWESDGMMVNAAVMGLFPRVRYVLLSDALLESMSVDQIEAVFGHEAGHVHHRHIQHFLVFAFVGWLIAVGLMELLARAIGPPAGEAGLLSWAVQGAGVAATVLFWGVGFGWLSRRTERQADVFGASCVAPEAADCHLPCSVHSGRATSLAGQGRVCATGAAIFASALDRVALLNGIPYEERSWRHSSIGSRIRFLTSLAGDPGRAVRFGRTLRRVRIAMLILAVVGAVATGVYCYLFDPALLAFQAGAA